MSPGARLGGAAGAMMVLLLALCGGGLIALAPDIALPVGVLLAPGLVGLLFDPTPGRAVARAMLLFTAASGFRPVADAWVRCDGIASCMDMLAGPRAVLVCWTMAALAWILTQTLPLGLKLLSDHRVRARCNALEARRDSLVADWGLDASR
jgi:hypothetical protein